jgi:hypothetical protein
VRKGSTKLKESTRQRKHDEKLAELLGITLEDVLASREQEERDDKVLEAQAVMLFLEKPEAFIQKICKECGQHFLTTYSFVSDCSSPCRIKALARIGITWNPMHNQSERWARAQIPTGYSIPPKALEILIAIAQEQQQAQEQAECVTDEPHELSQHTEQSKTEPQIDQVVWPPELDSFSIPDFSLE